MKQLTLAYILVLINFYSLYSQSVNGELYLKNGSILKGTLIQNDSSVLKLKLRDGNIWAFKPTEIERLFAHVTNTTKLYNNLQTAFSLSAGSLIGSSVNEKQTPLSLSLELQIKIYHYASIGICSGLEFLNESVVPLGLAVKGYYPVLNGSELFAGISGGYLSSLEKPYDPYNYDYIDENKGGTYFNAEMGLLFSSQSRTRFFVAAGYRYAELHYTYTDNYWWPDKLDMYFNRLNLRFGFWIE